MCSFRFNFVYVEIFFSASGQCQYTRIYALVSSVREAEFTNCLTGPRA